MVDGQPGVAVFREDGGDLVHGGGVFGGHDVHPGGEDLLHLQVVELDGGADELPLMLVQAALVLGLIHHGDELLLGDALLLRLAEDAAEELLPLGKEVVHRGQHRHQHPHDGGCEHGKGLGVLFGHALGGDLAKDQNNHGQHHRGDQRTVVQKQLGEQNGAHGGGRDVHDVVADQVGGQELVVVLRDAQGQGSPLVAAVRPALEPDAVERGKGGLGGGEKGGEDHEDHKGGDHTDTGWVQHTDKSTQLSDKIYAQRDSPIPRRVRLSLYSFVGGY